MLPFSLFSTSNVIDKVILYQSNPRFDEALYKDTFQIRSTEYTRCAVIVTPNSKKGRKGKSPIWKASEAILSSKDSKRYFYCYYCEVAGSEQQMPTCHNGNSPVLDHLINKHQLDRITGDPVVGAAATIKSSFMGGVVYQQLTKSYALDEFKALIVRWMVHCHIAFRLVGNEYFRDHVTFLSSSMGRFLPRTASTIRGWVMEAYEVEKAAVKQELRSAVSNVHLSFDGWPSPNHYSILSVFAHFIDSGGVRRIRLLAFRRTFGAKSATNEAAALIEFRSELYTSCTTTLELTTPLWT
jgi:hypothetical protein